MSCIVRICILLSDNEKAPLNPRPLIRLARGPTGLDYMVEQCYKVLDVVKHKPWDPLHLCGVASLQIGLISQHCVHNEGWSWKS